MGIRKYDCEGGIGKGAEHYWEGHWGWAANHKCCFSLALLSEAAMFALFQCFSIFQQFRWLFIVQWDFCLDIISVHALCLSHVAPPQHFLTFSLHSVLTVISVFPCVLFLHRCDVLYYYSLSFFSSFSSSLVSSTSPTFGYMFSIYLYVYTCITCSNM
jgi:hypothetical protein